MKHRRPQERGKKKNAPVVPLKRCMTIEGREWTYLVTKSLVKIRDADGKTTTISREKFHNFPTVTPADVKRFILNGLKPVDYTNDTRRAEWEKLVEDGDIFVDDDGDPLDPEDDFYPEHAKLKAAKDDLEKIGGFLEWLTGEREIVLCTRRPGQEIDNIWMPLGDERSIEKLLAEYFQIDEARLETEKRAILEAQRKANAT